MSLLLIEDSINDRRVPVEWIIIWAIHLWYHTIRRNVFINHKHMLYVENPHYVLSSFSLFSAISVLPTEANGPRGLLALRSTPVGLLGHCISAPVRLSFYMFVAARYGGK